MPMAATLVASVANLAVKKTLASYGVLIEQKIDYPLGFLKYGRAIGSMCVVWTT
jgi:hypothetical protein